MVNTSCPSDHSGASPGRPDPWHTVLPSGVPQPVGLLKDSVVLMVPSSYGRLGKTGGLLHSVLAAGKYNFLSTIDYYTECI